MSISDGNPIDLQVGSDHGPGKIGWLVAGIVSSVAIVFAVYLVRGQFLIPYTSEFFELNIFDPADNARAAELVAENNLLNHQRFLFGVAAPFAAVFAVAAALIAKRPWMGLVGAFVGAGIAIVLGNLTAGLFLEGEQVARNDIANSDLRAIGLHTAQWLLIGMTVFAGVWIAGGRLPVAFKAFGSIGAAALVASVGYVIAGSVIDPDSHTTAALPIGGVSRLFWASSTPVLAGFFMAGIQRKTKQAAAALEDAEQPFNA